jgi:3-methyladenine DNA glycosylase/8-oxoguanine DNA glycosylase
VQRLLRTVSGVGVWTAAETSQRAHGDPDAVSFGDYHLAATIGWALVGSPIDDDALAELLEPWAGQRQRVVRLVLASGFRPPRHGPRMTIQDHRWH